MTTPSPVWLEAHWRGSPRRSIIRRRSTLCEICLSQMEDLPGFAHDARDPDDIIGHSQAFPQSSSFLVTERLYVWVNTRSWDS